MRGRELNAETQSAQRYKGRGEIDRLRDCVGLVGELIMPEVASAVSDVQVKFIEWSDLGVEWFLLKVEWRGGSEQWVVSSE